MNNYIKNNHNYNHGDERAGMATASSMFLLLYGYKKILNIYKKSYVYKITSGEIFKKH